MVSPPTLCRAGPVSAGACRLGPRRVDARACALARLRAGVRRGFFAAVAARFVRRAHATASARALRRPFVPRRLRVARAFSWLARGRGRLGELPRHPGERVLERLGLDGRARTCVGVRAAPTRVLADLTARPAPYSFEYLLRARRTRSCQRDQLVLVEVDECGRSVSRSSAFSVSLSMAHTALFTALPSDGSVPKRSCSVLGIDADDEQLPPSPAACTLADDERRTLLHRRRRRARALQRRTRARHIRIVRRRVRDRPALVFVLIARNAEPHDGRPRSRTR